MTNTLDRSTGSIAFLAHDPELHGAPLEPGTPLVAATNEGGRGVILAQVWNRYGGLLERLAERTGIEVGAAIAVLAVESSGRGFGDDGRLIVRFEPHIFRRYLGTGRRREFDEHFRIEGRVPWEGHSFRRGRTDAWRPFHGSQRSEWDALAVARGLDEDLALRSTSMGLAQVMGFNHALIGYRNPTAMFEAFCDDVRFQVLALFDFIRGGIEASQAVLALRREDYVEFARFYNGVGQAHYYGALIEADVAAFRALRDPGAFRTYTVVPGDNLTRIGRRFGVSVSALVEANRIPNPDLIYPGQRLTIPPR